MPADSTTTAASAGAPPPTTVLRARNADLLVFAVDGFMFATWMSRLPDIKSMLHLSPGWLGVLLLAISVGALIGLPIAGRLIHRLGPVTVIRVGAALSLSGVAFAAVAADQRWPLAAVWAGLVFLGFGRGIWDVAQNLEGTVIEQAIGRSTMPWFHAAYSGGTVTAALIAVLLIRLHVPVLTHVLVMTALGAILIVWSTARFLPAPDAGTDTHDHRAAPRPARSAWTEPRTLLIGVMVLAAAFTEGVANDWLAVGFVDGHGVTPALGVLAFAVFLISMTAGRILGTRVLDQYGRVPVLRSLFACAILGSALVVFGTTPLAFIGAAIWGIGASLGFPVGMSAAADDPRRAAFRLSVVTTIGYSAFLAGPALIGFLGNQTGILPALTAVGLTSLLALLVVPAARPLPTEPSDGET